MLNSFILLFFIWLSVGAIPKTAHTKRDIIMLRYKNETNPKYKFITASHNCSNTECKNYDVLQGCKRFKSCKKSIAWIEVIGLHDELQQLMKLLRKSRIEFYLNKSFPCFVYKGKHFKMIIVNNNTINNAFEKHCNQFNSVIINGRNPFI